MAQSASVGRTLPAAPVRASPRLRGKRSRVGNRAAAVTALRQSLPSGRSVRPHRPLLRARNRKGRR